MAHYREVGEVIMTTGHKGCGYIMLLIMCGMYIRNISVVTLLFAGVTICTCISTPRHSYKAALVASLPHRQLGSFSCALH